MGDQGHARRQARVQAQDEDHGQLAEVVKTADHTGCRDGGADARHEDVRDEQKIGQADVVGEEEDPVEEEDAQPDNQGQDGVEGQLTGGLEELETVDELAEDLEDGRAGLFGERFEDEADDAEGPLPEEIEEEGRRQEGRGDGQADRPPDGQLFARLWADGPGPGEEGPGQEEESQEQAHRRHVEDALDDDRAHGEARPQAFLAGEVQGLGQLAQTAGEDGADRVADDVPGDKVAEADIDLLPGDEDVPAEGPGDEMEGRPGDEQEEERDVDVGDVGGDLAPLDTAAEEIEENGHEDDGDSDFKEVPAHRLATILP